MVLDYEKVCNLSIFNSDSYNIFFLMRRRGKARYQTGEDAYRHCI